MAFSLGFHIYRLATKLGARHIRTHVSKRLALGKEDATRLEERFGTAGHARPGGRLIWFHAASVGESMSLLELIHRLGQDHPDVHFLITTGTKTSAEVMAARLPDRAIHQYAPVDAPSAVSAFLNHWQPDLAVWTESEFWPILIDQTRSRGVPMVLINARMSRKSIKRWRWAPHFARRLLSAFRNILAQDRVTAAGIQALGVPKDRIEVTGTLKEGSAALPHDEAERTRLANQIGGRAVWLASSTHDGEEDIITKAHALAAKKAHRLLLILTPRHPERGDQLAQELRDQGWNVAQRSKAEGLETKTDIYLADTLGELGLWYRLAPVSFIGGSLVPIGGHNPYEPAALGSAILYGPDVTNFEDIYGRLTDHNAAIQVSDAADLATTVIACMAPDKAAEMAHAAWEVCSDGAEVTDRVLAVLKEHLPT